MSSKGILGKFLTVLAAASAAAVLGVSAAAAQSARAVGVTPPRLSFVDGEVSYWRPGAEDWVPAQINTALAAGDSLYASIKPCVLVLDADLADMDGWELWRRVSARKGTKRPSAVLVSRDPVDATRARLARIGEFLQKPIANDRLIEILERHCPYRFSWTPKGVARWLRRAVDRHSVQVLKEGIQAIFNGPPLKAEDREGGAGVNGNATRT